MWTKNFQMYKLHLEKAEEPENQIANICWITEKAVEFPKSSNSASLIVQKLLYGSQQTVEYS